MRTAAPLVALVILAGGIGGCGDGDETGSTTTPSEAAPTDAGLTDAIEGYWDLLAAEEYAEAYDVLSDECRNEISEEGFAEGFQVLFDQASTDGFNTAAQVVRVDIDEVEPGVDERVRTVQWSLAPSDDPKAEETVSITGGDQDTWTFDGEWHADAPECGGGTLAAQQAEE